MPLSRIEKLATVGLFTVGVGGLAALGLGTYNAYGLAIKPGTTNPSVIRVYEIERDLSQLRHSTSLSEGKLQNIMALSERYPKLVEEYNMLIQQQEVRDGINKIEAKRGNYATLMGGGGLLGVVANLLGLAYLSRLREKKRQPQQPKNDDEISGKLLGAPCWP